MQQKRRDVIAKRWNIFSKKQSSKLVAEGLLTKMLRDESLRNAPAGPALPWSSLPRMISEHPEADQGGKILCPAMKISPWVLLVVWYRSRLPPWIYKALFHSLKPIVHNLPVRQQMFLPSVWLPYILDPVNHPSLQWKWDLPDVSDNSCPASFFTCSSGELTTIVTSRWTKA